MPNLKITPFRTTRPQNPLGWDSGRWTVGRRKDGYQPPPVEATTPIPSPIAMVPSPPTRRVKKPTIIVIAAVLGLLALIGAVVGVVVGVSPKTSDTTNSSNATSTTILPHPASPHIPPPTITFPISSATSAPPLFSTSSLPSTLSTSSTSSVSPVPSASVPELPPVRVTNSLAAAFASSSWIWMGIQALISAPAGDWAFRISLPTSTAPATTAVILLAVDDAFALYHNGQLIANSTILQLNWKLAMAFQVSLDPDSNVFAIHTQNFQRYAGLLSSIQISYADGFTTIISSDSTWRVTQPVPDGFESPSFDDSQWAPATVLAEYGSLPWFSRVTLVNDLSLS
ncbi:hypothetical protein BD779DRAFT_1799348 [Infundibulicybe gibba]|nr:hypothetical protein BD779DRAFT_1799348 [Infundibulicybe gibba]